MGLLVTTFLVLVNIFNTVINNSPNTEGVTAMGSKFLVFIQNRLISSGLEPDLIHTKKTMSRIVLYPVFYEYKIVQS